MLVLENHLGKIQVSQKYLMDLVRDTVEGCFGVAGIVSCKGSGILGRKTAGMPCDEGISIRRQDDALMIELHIIALYGTNIAAIVKSIMHKVSYVVEEHVRLSVSKVNVFVDGMKQ